MGMMGKVLPIRLDLPQPTFRKFRDGTGELADPTRGP